MQQEPNNTLREKAHKKEMPVTVPGREVGAEFQLQRLLRILPGEKDSAEKVQGLLNDTDFLERLSANQLLDASRCALEHGLVDRGIELLTMVNSRFPKLEEAWKEHQEILGILGDSKAVLALRYRAKRCLEPQAFSKIFGSSGQDLSVGGLAQEGNHGLEEEIQDKGGPEGLESVFRPFLDARQHNEHIRTFMSLFRGRGDVFARQWVDHSRQNSGYMPVRRPMTSADVEDHLKGSKTYGIYLMNPDNTVWTGVIDIDLRKKFRQPGTLKGLTGPVKREVRFILENIRSSAAAAEAVCIAEFSGGKGYHLWFPVREPVQAGAMRQALSCMARSVSGKTEFFQLEIFPKQDRLTGKGLGNLVKLPLGIHRVTGKRSFFVLAGSRERERQLSVLAGIRPTAGEKILKLAMEAERAEVIVHPASARLAERFPELFHLQQACDVISGLVSGCLAGKDPGERGRKVLISTIGHMAQGRYMLHHLLSKTADYNRPLLDYEISRLRGSPLGCKRIHSLMGRGEGGLDCAFELKKGEYAHPLLHLESWETDKPHLPKAGRIEDLQDALLNLKAAVEIVERFL